MRNRPTILFFGPVGRPVPDFVRDWAAENGFPVETHDDPEEILGIILRGHPCFVFVTCEGREPAGLDLIRLLKSDSFTAIAPALAICDHHDPEQIQAWFGAGADEILTDIVPAGGAAGPARGAADPKPSATSRSIPRPGLPGDPEIDREIRRRLDSATEFAVCYADLDHFKEYNDRYSYYDGDRVIYMLSRILHDVVKGLLGAKGFVGTSAATISSSSFPRAMLAWSARRFCRSSIRWSRFSTMIRIVGPDTSSARTGEGSCTGCRS